MEIDTMQKDMQSLYVTNTMEILIGKTHKCLLRLLQIGCLCIQCLMNWHI